MLAPLMQTAFTLIILQVAIGYHTAPAAAASHNNSKNTRLHQCVTVRGRPVKYTTNHSGVKHALELRKTTNKTIKEISEITGVSQATLYRRLKERNEH